MNMEQTQFLTSIDEELIDYNSNVIIPEYYYKCAIDLKKFNCYDDMSFSYKLTKTEKDYLYKIHYNIIEAIGKSIEKNYNLNCQKKLLLFVYSYPVINYIFWLYEKYKKVEMAVSKYNNLFVISKEFSKEQFNCKTLSDVRNLMENDDYNSYIYSAIVKKFDIKIKYIKINSIKRKKMPHLFTKNVLKKIIKYNIFAIALDSKIRHIVFSYIINKLQINYCNRRISNVAEILIIKSFAPYNMLKDIIDKSNGKIVTRDIDYFLSCENLLLKKRKINSSLRDKFLDCFKCSNKFEKILKEYILDCIPSISLEYFCDCYNYAIEYANSWSNIHKFYSAGGLGCFDSSTIVNIIAGLMSENKCRIIDIQHSAGYGVIKGLSEQEMIFFDEFVTWGWEDKNEKKIRPCRNIRFSINNHKNVLKNHKRKILYVTDGIYKYNSVGKHSNEFVEKHLEFVNLLPYEVRSMMTVRLRNNNYKLYERYKNEFPEIEIEWMTDSAFLESALSREIVIVDSNGSPFYECIMNCIPSIMLEAYAFEEYTDSMVEFFDKMINERMFFRNPKMCADEVLNFISNNYLFWTKSRKKLVEDIINYYFNEKADYVDTWLMEFLYK